jgi:hypothetical protein
MLIGNQSPGLGMKADRIGSDNTFTTSASIFFLDVERSGYYTDAVTDADFSDVGYGAESDRLWSRCELT